VSVLCHLWNVDRPTPRPFPFYWVSGTDSTPAARNQSLMTRMARS
jgi:hypothetical protein